MWFAIDIANSIWVVYCESWNIVQYSKSLFIFLFSEYIKNVLLLEPSLCDNDIYKLLLANMAYEMNINQLWWLLNLLLLS